MIDKKIDEFKQEGVKDEGIAIKEEIKKEVIEEKKEEDEDKENNNLSKFLNTIW